MKNALSSLLVMGSVITLGALTITLGQATDQPGNKLIQNPMEGNTIQRTPKSDPVHNPMENNYVRPMNGSMDKNNQTHTNNMVGTQKKSVLTQTDKTFATKAAQSSLAEIKMGKLAVLNTKNRDVLNLAGAMVTDHTNASNELKEQAEDLKMTLPTMPDNMSQMEYKKLSGLKGTAFDKAYLDMQVKAHQKSIALFKEQANKGQNSELKNFASKTLPTLEQHLMMTKQLQTSYMKK